MDRTVTIGASSGEAFDDGDGRAVVAVDVIRSTTTAVTAVALGRRCYPVPSLEVAVPLAARLDDPLLVGELGGNKPYGFHLNNSPAQIAIRTDVARPMVLISTSGTRLMCETARTRTVYVACLRNVSATVAHLAAHHATVALVGAETRGEFREEDQLCCARLAEGLAALGYDLLGDAPAVVERWAGQPVDAFAGNRSCEYLRSTGQLDDLEFILSREDDLDLVLELRDGEIAVVDPRSGAVGDLSAANAPERT